MSKRTRLMPSDWCTCVCVTVEREDMLCQIIFHFLDTFSTCCPICINDGTIAIRSSEPSIRSYNAVSKGFQDLLFGIIFWYLNFLTIGLILAWNLIYDTKKRRIFYFLHSQHLEHTVLMIYYSRPQKKMYMLKNHTRIGIENLKMSGAFRSMKSSTLLRTVHNIQFIR